MEILLAPSAPDEGMRDTESEAALAAAFDNGRAHEVTRLYRRDDIGHMGQRIFCAPRQRMQPMRGGDAFR